MAVSDFYTLLRGGSGIPNVEMPDSNAINDAVSNLDPSKIASKVPGMDFARPTLNTPPIKLKSEAVLSNLENAGLSDLDDAMNASKEQINNALDTFG